MNESASSGGISEPRRRVLVVEDNFIVAAGLRRMLERLGFDVVGPVADLERARSVAATERLDAGILDINIIGGTSELVAETLSSRGCPFFFVTGYGSPKMLPPKLSAMPRLNKPIDETRLQRALEDPLR